MNIIVQPYTPEKKTIWDEFVNQSNNGTLFHLQEFLEYHPSHRFSFNHLMFYLEDELIAVLPGGISNSNFNSPTGASLGGFVVPTTMKFEMMDQIVKCFISYCNSLSIQQIRITPPMQIYSSVFDEVIEYALLYNKFSYTNSLYSSVMDLRHVKGRENFARSPRYGANKAQNHGVEIIESNEYDRAYEILVENKKKFQTTPTHSLSELIYLHEHFPQKIKLFLAYYEGEPIAGEWIFLTNKNCGMIFYAMHLYEFRKLYALNLLLDHAIKWCAGNGFRFLDYGVSADTFHPDPMEPSRSLVRFKESVGCSGSLRRTYTMSL